MSTSPTTRPAKKKGPTGRSGQAPSKGSDLTGENDMANKAAVKSSTSVVASLTVHDVYKTFVGKVVLIPLALGTKKALRNGWPKTTWEQTQTSAYQKRLKQSDVGVLQGKAGDGYCSIDCDTDNAADELIAANPRLAGTLHTRGARGCNVWVRIEGEIPKSCKIKDSIGQQIGEWRADGNQTKILGVHPKTQLPYQWPVVSSPVNIGFNEINWPAGWGASCIKSDYDRLVEKHGGPYEEKGKSVKLNQAFFGGKFVLEHGVLFDPDEGRFYLYYSERGLWLPSTEATIKCRVLADLREYAQTQDQSREEQFSSAGTEQFAGGVARLIRGLAEKRAAFSSPARMVHVLNGMIEIQNGKVVSRPFSPDHLSRNQIQVNYDHLAKCDRFLKELLEPALSPDDIEIVQKWIGGVLLGGNLAQKIMIQEGKAGTGKSTLAEIVGKLIGPDNVTQLRTELLNERFETARYVGKRLLAGRDVPGDFLTSKGASTLKALTGGDDLDAEFKGSMGTAKIGRVDVLITTNVRLRVKLSDDVGAWRRRLLIVSYNRPPPIKPVPNFADELFRAEGGGILNWAIEGAICLLAELESDGRVQMPASQVQRVDDLLAESDSLRSFLKDSIVPAPSSTLTSEELLFLYTIYCDEKEWQMIPPYLVRQQLPDLMQEMFGAVRRNDIKRKAGDQRGSRGGFIF